MAGGLRIIAGTWGGRRLKVPTTSVRPTRDRVRQILFDILGPRGVAGSTLDLYAGSGALGLEALSRGADDAVFVESSAASVAILRENIAALGVRDACRVYSRTVERALPGLLGEGARFDLILADPPYGTGASAWLVRWLGGTGVALLGADGRVVIESERSAGLPEVSGLLVRWRSRPVGESELHFYAPSGGGPTRTGRSEISGMETGES